MRREGIDEVELAARVRAYGQLQREKPIGQVSRLLIEKLEHRVGNGFTHPHFADAIAAVCGATAKQRDMIVAERHRGTWRMTEAAQKRAERAKEIAVKAHPWRALPAVRQVDGKPAVQHYVRAVVKINRDGDVLKRYFSVMDAAVFNYCSDESVRARCQMKVKQEWSRGNVSYRYADQWDSMTPEEKKRSVGGEYGAAVE